MPKETMQDKLEWLKNYVEESKKKHSCGLQGFGQSIFDTCHTCEMEQGSPCECSTPRW